MVRIYLERYVCILMVYKVLAYLANDLCMDELCIVVYAA